MNIKLVLSAAFAVVAYFLGIIADANGNTQLPDGTITVDATIFLMASMFMIADAKNSQKSKIGV
jgi:hypothetical protein